MIGRLLGVTATALILGGCASSIRDHGARINGPPPQPDQQVLDKFKSGSEEPEIRRELAFNLIAKSDSACEDYLIGLSAQRNFWAGGLAVGASLLSTAGGVTTPVRSANLISAGSSAAQNTSRLLTETVFGGNEFRLLYSAVKNGREERRRQLFDDINRGGFDKWSMQSIQTYLTPYHFDCGINYALDRLASASDAQGARPPSDTNSVRNMVEGQAHVAKETPPLKAPNN
jgi:hypothetical protein